MGRPRFEEDLPDDILSFQWCSDASISGEARLCWAILFDAVYVLVNKPYPTLQRDRDWVWIHSDDTSYAYSFMSICDLLGLSAYDIRAKVDQVVAKNGMLPRKYFSFHRAA